MIWANHRIRFVLTAECNINCFYCHNEGQPKTNHFFSEELFEHALKLIEQEKEELTSVTFTGGEPLLHPKIEQFSEAIARYSPRITVITNGVLLTKEKTIGLKKAGITKIRLGVDSFVNKKSRPTDGNVILGINVRDVISMILNNGIHLEINTVITKFNRKEIPSIIQFCQENTISAKFFELIEVEQFGDKTNEAQINLTDIIPFSEFQSAALSIIKNCTAYSDKEIPDDFVFEGNGFTIRYCKYLCISGSCYKTGTRIDPDGAIYTCMGQRGKYNIQATNSIELSKEIIVSAVKAGCKTWKKKIK